MFENPGRGDWLRNTNRASKSAGPHTTAWSDVVVLANRAPIGHTRTADGRLVVRRSPGGLVTALEPVVSGYGGTWVAHASSPADTDSAHTGERAELGAGEARYRLRYVPLSDADHRGYYYGFANEGLWPLCHDVNVAPVFRADDFRRYWSVNTQFTAAVAEVASGGSPLILVQDYHFALAPRMLRQRLGHATVVAFWHIPWPRPVVFRACPWGGALLSGLLGSHIVGLQTDDDCMNFLASVDATLDADVDLMQKTVKYRGQLTRVRAYPVGIEWSSPAARTAPPPAECRERVYRDLHLPAHVRLGIGIDRLDYTKGLNEKFLAVERLLERRPDLRQQLSLVQVAEPSRDCLPAYRAARAQLRLTSERINRRFGTTFHQPVHLLEAHHEPADVYRLYRAADYCHVGSLRDGMNLVAKEFVSAREDERGVLVLSQYAGAATQLRSALLVNPLDIDTTADAVACALEMPAAKQATRMRILRASVERFDASWWSLRIVADATLDMSRGCPTPLWPGAIARSESA